MAEVVNLKKNKLKSFLKWFLILLLIIIIFALSFLSFLFFKPVSKVNIDLSFDKLSFDESLELFEESKQQSQQPVSDVCKDIILHNQNKTERVVILFHGFTNCPEQVSLLGNQFSKKGYNVLMPRTPRHGFRDVLNTAQTGLTSQELVDFLKRTLQIASGLGNKIDVFGISAGAVLAALASLYADNIETVLLAAPFFSPLTLPINSQNFIINGSSLVPNYMQWWDSELKQEIPGPKYAYPQFSTKALTAFLELSVIVKEKLIEYNENQKIARYFQKVVFLTVPNDAAINNQAVDDYRFKWARIPGLEIVNFQFLPEHNLVHDFIDVNQPNSKTDITYPVILSFFTDLNENNSTSVINPRIPENSKNDNGWTDGTRRPDL